MNKFCKQYISEIKAMFPIKRKAERLYIKKLRSDVEHYCEEAGVTTKQELYDNYGKPNEVVNGYFAALDTEYITKQIKTSRCIKTAVSIILILATIATSLFCFVLYSAYQSIERQEAVIYKETIVEY